jgi:steroid delta-isomerase-like uncharacterized protein
MPVVDHEWLDAYIEAWAVHPHAGGPDGADELARLLRFMSDDVRYEDVPSTMVFSGHDGIGEMCAGAFQMSSDLHFAVVSRQIDGRSYAFESVGRGTSTGAVGPLPATGAPIELRGVAVGTVSDDGRVTSHRDYWDMASLLMQLGVLPAPDFSA